jgi:hypothetical protein
LVKEFCDGIGVLHLPQLELSSHAVNESSLVHERDKLGKLGPRDGSFAVDGGASVNAPA